MVGWVNCACAAPPDISKIIAPSIALMTNPARQLTLPKLKHISLVGNSSTVVQRNV
jgi:hypothetical protein